MQIKTISAVGASTAYLAREHRRKAKRFIRASFTSLATLILGGNLALSAEPLDLDHTCNGTGQVVTNLHAPLSGFDEGRAVAVQQDGKIVALGATLSQPPKGFDFALVRYSPDCAMDTTFGGGGTGRVITDLGSIDDNPKAIVI